MKISHYLEVKYYKFFALSLRKGYEWRFGQYLLFCVGQALIENHLIIARPLLLVMICENIENNLFTIIDNIKNC